MGIPRAAPLATRRETVNSVRARQPGAARARITTFTIYSLADTVQEARDKARPVVAEYLSLGLTHLSDGADITDEVNALLAKGGQQAVLEEMPDEWIDKLGVIGDATACRAMIEALTGAGADEIALVPVDPSGPSRPDHPRRSRPRPSTR
jgi:5,10-methylenetetrahydromethanopterin reductase